MNQKAKDNNYNYSFNQMSKFPRKFSQKKNKSRQRMNIDISNNTNSNKMSLFTQNFKTSLTQNKNVININKSQSTKKSKAKILEKKTKINMKSSSVIKRVNNPKISLNQNYFFASNNNDFIINSKGKITLNTNHNNISNNATNINNNYLTVNYNNNNYFNIKNNTNKNNKLQINEDHNNNLDLINKMNKLNLIKLSKNSCKILNPMNKSKHSKNKIIIYHKENYTDRVCETENNVENGRNSVFNKKINVKSQKMLINKKLTNSCSVKKQKKNDYISGQNLKDCYQIFQRNSQKNISQNKNSILSSFNFKNPHSKKNIDDNIICILNNNKRKNYNRVITIPPKLNTKQLIIKAKKNKGSDYLKMSFSPKKNGSDYFLKLVQKSKHKKEKKIRSKNKNHTSSENKAKLFTNKISKNKESEIKITIQQEESQKTFIEKTNSIKESKETNENKENKEKENNNNYNPQYAKEYLDEILFTLYKDEQKFFNEKRVDQLFLISDKCEITPEMRTVIVDWIIEVHQIFNFKEKSLYISVQLLDQYLSKNKVTTEDLQLLAITCINIATKHEEVEFPILDNYITISYEKYTKQDVIQMETKVLSCIEFEIFKPNILEFFEIFSYLCSMSQIEIFQGNYLLNIILMDVNMLEFNYSLLAFCVCKIVTKKNVDEVIINFLEETKKKLVNEEDIKMYYKNIEILKNEKKVKELVESIRLLFRTVMKTHYVNAKNKFATQKFQAISTYTVI